MSDICKNCEESESRKENVVSADCDDPIEQYFLCDYCFKHSTGLCFCCEEKFVDDDLLSCLVDSHGVAEQEKICKECHDN